MAMESGSIEIEHKEEWLDNIESILKQAKKNSSKSMLSKGANAKSLKKFDTSQSAPKEYLCPISLDLMKDPVLLIETGQVYDRESIEGWFKAGKNTCPTTGANLKSKRLSPIHPLRSAISEFAKKNGIILDVEKINEMTGLKDVNVNEETILQQQEQEEINLSIINGVSVFDIKGLCGLALTDNPKRHVALRLLADMAKYGDRNQIKSITQNITQSQLLNIVENDDNLNIRSQAGRLLIYFPGDEIPIYECIKIFLIDHIELQEEILLKVWQYAYRQRNRMLEIANMIENINLDIIVNNAIKVSDPTSNNEISEDTRAYATFLLACLSIKKIYRLYLVQKNIVEFFIHFLTTTSDVGFRFCLLKSTQYLCEYPEGRSQVIKAGGTRIFIMHLPPRNPSIHFTTRVFADWFAWVTVAETAVKALYFLSKDEDARQQMQTSATMKALRIIYKDSEFSDGFRTKYLIPLFNWLQLNT